MRSALLRCTWSQTNDTGSNKTMANFPEGNSHEPVSWSSEEISVSRGNFLGKMQSVREARVVRSTGSELREGWSRRMWREWGLGRRREELKLNVEIYEE